MKYAHKFLIVFLAVTMVFSAVCGVFAYIGLERIREDTNRAIIEMITAVKEKYPNVSDIEIAEILNSAEDGEEAKSLLKKYGIDVGSDWAVYSDEADAKALAAGCTLICALSGTVFCSVFAVYCIRRKREVGRITEYIKEINRKNYDLSIEENSEDDISLLKNEIYKTTVMLKEQSENSQMDKENLKDSLSDISHQLKTPLTSIMVMLDSITDDADMPAEIRMDFLNDIRRETSSISFLVQSILTLSKLDADSIVFKSNPESVSKIIEASITSVAVLAELKEVALSGGCDESIKINCDFKWFCEAITNIVKNCIEHTGKGGEVNIVCEQNKLYTKIIIEDNGSGIAQKDLPHIFERFYKGCNSSDDSVGIGLALAKAIIEKSGGYIGADSEPGKGTKFSILCSNEA